MADAQSAERQTLRGHVPALAAGLQPINRLAASTRLNFAIGLPLRNQQALTNLFQELYNPASTNYHRYLTSQQFTERFGPTEQDYQAVIAFAQTNGFTITETDPGRTLLNVSASVADIEKTLHVAIRVYQHPTETRTFFAPDTEPSIDLTIPVLHIDGLDSHFRSHPNLSAVPSESRTISNPNGGSGVGGKYQGYDFRAAYVPGVTWNGNGQTVGLYELEGYSANDITTYETLTGLPNVPVQNVPLDGFSFIPTSTDTNGIIEVCLDIEVAIAMAPGLSQVLVYGATNGYSFGNDILNRMANDNLAKQLSSSWGINVNATTEQIFQRFAVQGQSFLMAVGDSGAFTGPISQGSDDPYITTVGGTTLTTDAATNWVSEVVWNNSGGISGGGISTTYAIPSWQLGISMSANQGSTTNRNVPDVAMIGDNVTTIARNGLSYYTTGTSIAAPLWAGFIALANQRAAILGKPPVGFLNPSLYELSKGPGYGSVLHDVTVGNNTNTNSPSKFFAAAGYDLCTGLGTPTGINLINALILYNGGVWLDFNYTGTTQNGGYDTPYKTLVSATNAVSVGGTILIKTTGSSSEKMTITKAMSINAIGGAATIGK